MVLLFGLFSGETPSNNVVTFAVIGILSTLLIVAVAVIVLRSKVNRDSHTTQDTRAVDATVEMVKINTKTIVVFNKLDKASCTMVV